MAEKKSRDVSPEGREAHRAVYEGLKAERWGGAVKTVTVQVTLPEALAHAIKAEARRTKKPAGAVLCGLLDPEKVTALP